LRFLSGEGSESVLRKKGTGKKRERNVDRLVHLKFSLVLREKSKDGSEDANYGVEVRRKDQFQLTLAMQRKTRSVSKGSKRKSRGCPIAQPRRTRIGMTKRATAGESR
jgi:hypothetical protein